MERWNCSSKPRAWASTIWWRYNHCWIKFGMIGHDSSSSHCNLHSSDRGFKGVGESGNLHNPSTSNWSIGLLNHHAIHLHMDTRRITSCLPRCLHVNDTSPTHAFPGHFQIDPSRSSNIDGDTSSMTIMHGLNKTSSSIHCSGIHSISFGGIQVYLFIFNSHFKRRPLFNNRVIRNQIRGV